MPPLVTSLPWLSNQPDPVQTYQRSQALVQQMQAQQAQERQQQAVIAQRAQESAMQAQFQQRALALKEQEAKSAVQVEADRLRQRQQGIELDQKKLEYENQLANQQPSLVSLPGMPPGIMAGGRYYPGTRTPDLSRVAQSTPIHQDNDPSKPVIANFVWSNERGGAVVPLTRGLTPEEKKSATEEKDFATRKGEAEKFNRSELVKERDRLAAQAKPGSDFWESATPEEQAAATNRLSEIQKELDAYRKPPVRADSKKPTVTASTGVRIKRKSDGKVFRYEGNRADVKLDEFNIIE